MNPLVSVLTTAYNRQAYIGECIESILGSDFEDFELLIVDDCSSDDTYQIAKSFEERDSRVKVFRNDHNLGDYPNRNRAASMARGKYLKYLDSDDVIYPHGLGVMVRAMELYPEAALGLSNDQCSFEPFPKFLLSLEAYRINFCECDIFGRAPGSAIVLRSAFEQVDGFSGEKQIGDHELWLRLAREFPIILLPPDLVWDRTHGEQEKTSQSIAERNRLHSNVILKALSHPNCPLHEDERRLVLRKLLS